MKKEPANGSASAELNVDTTNGKSDRSRRHILDAAAQLFRDQGYAATTLRQIAKKADMKAGSIYYHFGSKDEILSEVIELGQEAVFETAIQGLEMLPDDAPFRLRIEKLIEGHLMALHQHGAYTSANIRVFGQLPEELKNRHRAPREAYGEYWEKMFRDAKEAGDIRSDLDVVALRSFVLGAINWTVEWYNPQAQPVDLLAKRVTRLLMDGIAT